MALTNDGSAALAWRVRVRLRSSAPSQLYDRDACVARLHVLKFHPRWVAQLVPGKLAVELGTEIRSPVTKVQLFSIRRSTQTACTVGCARMGEGKRGYGARNKRDPDLLAFLHEHG